MPLGVSGEHKTKQKGRQQKSTRKSHGIFRIREMIPEKTLQKIPKQRLPIAFPVCIPRLEPTAFTTNYEVDRYDFYAYCNPAVTLALLRKIQQSFCGRVWNLERRQ